MILRLYVVPSKTPLEIVHRRSRYASMSIESVILLEWGVEELNRETRIIVTVGGVKLIMR